MEKTGDGEKRKKAKEKKEEKEKELKGGSERKDGRGREGRCL